MMNIIHGYGARRNGNTRRSNENTRRRCDRLHSQFSIIISICILLFFYVSNDSPAPSDVCKESEWFVFGRWNELSNMSERGGLYIGNDKAWSNGWQAWSNDSQSAWRNTRSVCFFLIGRGELKKQSACSTGLWLKPVLKTFLTSFAIFWTQKRLKLGMVSSFDPHNICEKVERVTTKTGRTSCTNWTISFEVWGF